MAPLAGRYPGRLRPEALTLENFNIAASLVASRAFGVDEWHGEGGSAAPRTLHCNADGTAAACLAAWLPGRRAPAPWLPPAAGPRGRQPSDAALPTPPHRSARPQPRACPAAPRTGDAMVPLADIFNHKASVVELGPEYAVHGADSSGSDDDDEEEEEEGEEEEQGGGGGASSSSSSSEEEGAEAAAAGAGPSRAHHHHGHGHDHGHAGGCCNGAAGCSKQGERGREEQGAAASALPAVMAAGPASIYGLSSGERGPAALAAVSLLCCVLGSRPWLPAAGSSFWQRNFPPCLPLAFDLPLPHSSSLALVLRSQRPAPAPADGHRGPR